MTRSTIERRRRSAESISPDRTSRPASSTPAFALAGANLGKGSTKREGPIVDTIFLLSDGGPTDNKTDAVKPMDPEIILDNVRGWNKDLNVVIHTVAVHTLEAGTYFLQQLAAQNNGEFRARSK